MFDIADLDKATKNHDVFNFVVVKFLFLMVLSLIIVPSSLIYCEFYIFKYMRVSYINIQQKSAKI